MLVRSILIICLLMLAFLCVSAGATVIEGVVVTEQGPLPGAVVKAYHSLQDALSGGDPICSNPGEKPGFFRLNLPVGTYYITAAGERDQKVFFAFHGANPIKVEDKPIWLPFAATPFSTPVPKAAETSQIIGSVHNKGKPVVGAQVSIYPITESSIRGLGIETKSTDANGRFMLSPVPGSYFLIARKRMGANGTMPLTKGDLFCFYGANPVTVADKQQLDIDISCHPKDELDAFLARNIKVKRSHAELSRFREWSSRKSDAGISGHVRDRDGKPVGNIQITAYKRDPDKIFQMHLLRLASENMVRSDSDGKYFLPLNEAGTYYLVARQFGGESPLKGELFGLYEGNADHAVTVRQEIVTADIVVGRVMDELPRDEPSLVRDNADVDLPIVKAPSVIDRDTVWSGEVMVEGAVLVARTATLKIAPGTIVRFKRIDHDGDGVGDGGLRVTGRIIARGTPEKPIRFVSAEDAPRPGDWSYLLLFTSGQESVIQHCIFNHAFTGLQVHFSRAVIRDSVFQNNREGIRFGRAEIVVEHNEIINNDVGIRYHRLEGPVAIHGNLITKNGVGLFLVPSSQKSVDSSAAAYVPDVRYYIPPLIRNNSISSNLRYNYQLGERLATDIPLGGNWWGDNDVAIIRETIFDRERDPELGSVTINPVLLEPAVGIGPRKGDR